MSEPSAASWEALEASQDEGGMHHHFAKLVGKWSGEAKTWFEPGKLADTSPIAGEFALVLDGHYLKHDYQGTLMDSRMIGEETIACNVDLERLEMAWINTCHTRSQIMKLVSPIPEVRNPFSIGGKYLHAHDHPEWGWRVEFDLKSPDELQINHFNITPEGKEALAIEIAYRRV